MKANVGSTDKIIRIIAAIIIAVLYYTGQISGTIGIVLLVLGAVLVLTSLVNFCPLYMLFRISTKAEQK
ncbi:DUF2892 domain-containing protein [Daejeonella sp. H1SJ63]|jgi:hypothetical protein|uniref:YgaP family membrane protein n=1 Tax=Daejeonella sp. H1SJ63 TaxID=3034145 RepID=UPI0023EB5F16|nr:DUF2892 domain-containing protein [Daejeonella sp. H1SJ63]